MGNPFQQGLMMKKSGKKTLTRRALEGIQTAAQALQPASQAAMGFAITHTSPPLARSDAAPPCLGMTSTRRFCLVVNKW
jgi:hypothetical protein